MVALTEDVIREAAALRRWAAELRAETRIVVRRSHRSRDACRANHARACQIRTEPVASPWSELEWLRPDEELDQVLVAVARPRP